MVLAKPLDGSSSKLQRRTWSAAFRVPLRRPSGRQDPQASYVLKYPAIENPRSQIDKTVSDRDAQGDAHAWECPFSHPT